MHIIVTVHGIRTFGQWQERLTALLSRTDPNLRIFNYKYGYFSIVAFLFPFMRWLVTSRFRRELLRLARSHPGARIDVVAHSFGTHLVGWAIQGTPFNNRPRIHTVILAGSVLRSSFPWGSLLDAGFIERVINECGIRDNILILNQAFVLFTGMAGRLGFAGMTSDRFTNNYYDFGHSGYFLSSKGPCDDFMIQRWLPLLAGDHSILLPVDLRKPTAWQGVITSILQNIEPIKFVVYFSPLAGLLMVYIGLYNNAQAQRNLALSRQLAVEAQLIRIQDPRLIERSALLAIESLRRAPSEAAESALREGVRILPRRTASLNAGHSADDITWSQDGAKVLIAPHRSLASTLLADDNRTATVLDTRNGAVLRLTHQTSVVAAAISPDSKWIATACLDNNVHLWDLESRSMVRTLHQQGLVTSLAFSSDSTQLAAAGMDNRIALLSTADRASGPMLALHHPEEKTPSPSGQIVTATDVSDASILSLQREQERSTKRVEAAKAIVAGNSTDEIKAERLIQLGDPNDTVRRMSAIVRQIQQHVQKGRAAVAFDRNGKTLVAQSGDGALSAWSTTTGRLRMHVKRPHAFLGMALLNSETRVLALSPVNSVAAVSFRDNTVGVYELNGGRLVTTLSHAEPVSAVVFSPSGEYVATASADRTGRLWNSKTGREILRVTHADAVNDVDISPDGNKFVTAGRDRVAHIWSVTDGRELLRIPSASPVQAVTFSPDGTHVAVSDTDGIVSIWETRSGGEISVAHGQFITRVVYGLKGHQLLTVSPADGLQPKSNAVGVWDSQSGAPIHTLNHNGNVRSLAVDSHHEFAATGSDDSLTHLWDLRTAEERAHIREDDSVVAVVFSPNGKLLAAASGVNYISTPIMERSEFRVRVWNVEDRRDVRLIKSESEVKAIQFSNDNRFLFVGTKDGGVEIVEAQTGNRVSLLRHPGEVQDIRVNPRTGVIAVICNGRDLLLWKDWMASKATMLARLTQSERIADAQFSPNGEYFASGFGDKVRLWSGMDFHLIREARHEGGVSTLAFDCASKHLATGGGDAAVRVWTIPDLEQSAIMRHNSNILSVVFSPDGRHLASGSQDGTARIWQWPVPDLIEDACSHLKRNLSTAEWSQFFGLEPYRKTCPKIQ